MTNKYQRKLIVILYLSTSVLHNNALELNKYFLSVLKPTDFTRNRTLPYTNNWSLFESDDRAVTLTQQYFLASEF